MFRTKNNSKPSKAASYNWDGCLGNKSIEGNITLQGTELTLPTSSPLIKFAILPKKIPIGATIATTSRYLKALTPSFFANQILFCEENFKNGDSAESVTN